MKSYPNTRHTVSFFLNTVLSAKNGRHLIVDMIFHIVSLNFIMIIQKTTFEKEKCQILSYHR